MLEDKSKTGPLQEYWEEHRAVPDEDDFASPQLSPFTMAQRKIRTLSTATLSGDDRQTLPAFHPALGMLDYIDFFGPLIYPLHRAALLRQRILFVTSPPIRQACEFGK
jgi:DENN domain-containing protein 11